MVHPYTLHWTGFVENSLNILSVKGGTPKYATFFWTKTQVFLGLGQEQEQKEIIME